MGEQKQQEVLRSLCHSLSMGISDIPDLLARYKSGRYLSGFFSSTVLKESSGTYHQIAPVSAVTPFLESSV